MSGPHTYARRDTTQVLGVQFYGIPEREKQPDDIREAPGIEVKIPQQGVLVQRVLRRHSGQKCKENRGIHTAPAGRRQTGFVIPVALAKPKRWPVKVISIAVN